MSHWKKRIRDILETDQILDGTVRDTLFEAMDAPTGAPEMLFCSGAPSVFCPTCGRHYNWQRSTSPKEKDLFWAYDAKCHRIYVHETVAFPCVELNRSIPVAPQETPAREPLPFGDISNLYSWSFRDFFQRSPLQDKARAEKYFHEYNEPLKQRPYVCLKCGQLVTTDNNLKHKTLLYRHALEHLLRGDDLSGCFMRNAAE